MATTRSYVKVDSNYRRLERRFEAAAERALREAAGVAAAVSRAEASKRKKTGAMADIKISPVLRDSRGPNVMIASAPVWARFHEYGTLGRRRRKLVQPSRRTQTTGQGLKPLRFMAKGRTAARRALIVLLVRETSRVR